MINLREETLATLAEYGKTWADVIGVFLCLDDSQITKEQFWELSDKLYSNSYGGVIVRMDLMIVGKDFWLERHEYDGSEWWEYKQAPDLQNKPFVTDVKLFDPWQKYGGSKMICQQKTILNATQKASEEA